MAKSFIAFFGSRPDVMRRIRGTFRYRFSGRAKSALSYFVMFWPGLVDFVIRKFLRGSNQSLAASARVPSGAGQRCPLPRRRRTWPLPGPTRQEAH